METEKLSIEKIEKRILQLVLLAIVVILYLTLTVLALQFLKFFERSEIILLSENAVRYSVFLSILTLLFCGYLFVHQRKLHRLSRALLKEKETALVLRQDVKTLSSLLEVGSSINSQQKLSDILDTITKEILSCFDADHSSIMLVDQHSKLIKTKVSIGKGSEIVKQAMIPIGESVAGFVVKSGKPLILNGQVDPTDFPGTKKKKIRITSAMCVPLKIGEKSIGVLNVNLVESERTFSENNLKLTTIFANNVAVAIQNAKLYQEIRLFNEQLEEKIKERTMELEVAIKVKNDFLASISHELRTPLNAIVGFSQVLLDQHFGDLNEKQEEYAREISKGGKHLNALISDILSFSEVDTGKMELELSPVNIKALLENSIMVIKEKASKKKISLDLQIPPELTDLAITADERKIKQVLFNLLANAVKFAPEKGAITIVASHLSFANGHLQTADGQIIYSPMTNDQELMTHRNFLKISVADTGIGIAPEDQGKIFDEFYQVQSGTTDKTPGTGLGLSLTKRLVEMHGGKIWVESEGEGKGSRFSFVIPIKIDDS